MCWSVFISMVEQLTKVLEELAEQGKLEETVEVLEKFKRTSTRKDDSRCTPYVLYCLLVFKSSPLSALSPSVYLLHVFLLFYRVSECIRLS